MKNSCISEITAPFHGALFVCFPAFDYRVHLYVFDASTVSFSLRLAALTSLL